MADRSLVLEIVTPDRNLFSGEVNMVIAPGALGEIGILPLHAPLLAELSVGELRFKFDKEGGQEAEEYVSLHGGFMEVFEDKISIITPAAEFAREIDIERAKATVQELEEAMRKKENVDSEKVQAALLSAQSSLRIASRFSK